MIETWFVVLRPGSGGPRPLAAFSMEGLAVEWRNSSKHRFKDLIIRRRIAFRGIHGYTQKKFIEP